jgi:hypothetical protein
LSHTHLGGPRRILADLVCGFLARSAEEMLLGRPFTAAEEQRLAFPLPPTMLPVLRVKQASWPKSLN